MNTFGLIHIVDEMANQEMRGFIAFDPSALAGARIVEASLELNDFGVTGDSLGQLGPLHVEEVNIGASLDSADFVAGALVHLAAFTGGEGLENPVAL